MLPGLMRTAATPASIAFSARLALKWMSAITGIGERRTIRGSASASSVFGTAHADDLAAGRGERGDLRRRRLDVVRLRQRHRLDDDRRAAADRDAADLDLTLAEAIAAQAYPGVPAQLPSRPDVVRRADEEQEQDERDPDDGEALVDLARTARPRTPSMSEKAMWPPSSGSSGSRLSSASERLISASTQR